MSQKFLWIKWRQFNGKISRNKKKIRNSDSDIGDVCHKCEKLRHFHDECPINKRYEEKIQGHCIGCVERKEEIEYL